MSRIRHHLTEHAAFDTIPLRIGEVPTSRKVYLDSVERDPEGTANQTHAQRQHGRIHVLAEIWTEPDGGVCWGRWRLVTGPIDAEGKDPPIFTVLPLDKNEARTASNLTDYLANERKQGKIPWLTPQYVATTLRGKVKSGEISNQAQLAAFIRSQVEGEWQEKTISLEIERDALNDRLEKAKSGIKEFAQKAMQATARAEQAEENERTALEKLEQALRNQASNSPGVAPSDDDVQIEELKVPAKSVTEQWRSKTKNSAYVNVGVDAYVEDVTKRGNRIYLTFIDSQGKLRQIHDFGVINGFVSGVFDYLSSRKAQRAVFLVTNKPGDSPMLASDTMMLDTYRHLWR